MHRHDDPAVLAARASWKHRGASRPPFAAPPAPGQESVWDYPRPPRVEAEAREAVVRHAATLIARSSSALRVLETASPPVVYFPPRDVSWERLRENGRASLCEWKGRAIFYDVVGDAGTVPSAAWAYPEPFEGYEALAGFASFYPRLLACTLGGEPVRPQTGGFYGGWVTDDIVGPFKGAPGTGGW